MPLKTTNIHTIFKGFLC